MKALHLAKAVGASSGPLWLLILLAGMEAGVPIPIPSDLVILLLGERASAGDLPLAAAILGLEVAALVGTGALFLAARGPGRALIERLGPRAGLTPDRVGRATALVERRGAPAVALGRATPGLRTVTVVAAGSTSVPPTRAFLWLFAGSTLFLQAHLLLGYFLGEAARDLIEKATGPLLIGVAAFALVGLIVWLVRRGRRGAQTWSEACCPACLAVGLLADRSEAGPARA